MDGYSVYVPRLLPQDERFCSGRRSCKGCGKALAARIVSKAADAAVLSRGAIATRFPGAASLSAHSYANDDAACDDMIERCFAFIDQINTSGEHTAGTRRKSIQKAIIGLNRQVLETDFVALEQVFQAHDNGLFICFDNDPFSELLVRRAEPIAFIQNERRRELSEQQVSDLIMEKQIPAHIVGAGFAYLATACPSEPMDLVAKVKKGLAADGNAFIQILTPCPTGWIFAPEKTVAVGLRAIQTGYFPLYEIIDGRARLTRQTEKLRPVQELLMMQKRFATFPPQLIPFIQKAVETAYAAIGQPEA